MGAELRVAPEVERDIADAYAWYDQQRPGLGREFNLCVDACISAICRAPELNPVFHENYRRRTLRRFPYAVFYEYEAGTVTVYCIIHTARDPNKWRQRLP